MRSFFPSKVFNAADVMLLTIYFGFWPSLPNICNFSSFYFYEIKKRHRCLCLETTKIPKNCHVYRFNNLLWFLRLWTWLFFGLSAICSKTLRLKFITRLLRLFWIVWLLKNFCWVQMWYKLSIRVSHDLPFMRADCKLIVYGSLLRSMRQGILWRS